MLVRHQSTAYHLNSLASSRSDYCVRLQHHTRRQVGSSLPQSKKTRRQSARRQSSSVGSLARPDTAAWHSLEPGLLWQGTEADALHPGCPASRLTPAWKVMLLSDGSVTRHLQLMTGMAVQVECTQMQELEDTAGLPSGTSQLTQPLLQRQVFLRTPSSASNGLQQGTALVYAASWWNAEQAGSYLRDQSLPIWASLSKGRTELYRDIQQVYCGNSPFLERQFGRKGPFWGRQYLFWHDRKPLTLIHEVFSTSLERYLGPSNVPDSS